LFTSRKAVIIFSGVAHFIVTYLFRFYYALESPINLRRKAEDLAAHENLKYLQSIEVWLLSFGEAGVRFKERAFYYAAD
jgi:hypothetical protein